MGASFSKQYAFTTRTKTHLFFPKLRDKRWAKTHTPLRCMYVRSCAHTTGGRGALRRYQVVFPSVPERALRVLLFILMVILDTSCLKRHTLIECLDWLYGWTAMLFRPHLSNFSNSLDEETTSIQVFFVCFFCFSHLGSQWKTQLRLESVLKISKIYRSSLIFVAW